MINEERLLKIIRAPKISEKNSDIKEKNNTVVFKVLKDASKKEILMAAEKIFEVKVKKVNTLIIKGKIKRYGKYINRRKNWKKAYLTLWEGQKLDFIEEAK